MKNMKRVFSLLICAVLIIASFSGCSKATQYSVSYTKNDSDVAIVSFNCAAPWGNLLKGTSSSARVKRFAAYMNAVKPDSIGTQEMNSDWLEMLGDLMSDYDSYGVVRGGDENEKKSEMNAVFWLKDKYDCVDKGTFWLSETPDTQSKYEGAGCYRICTYVVLVNKSDATSYIHFNTHLDNASDDARNFGAQVILDKISEISALYPDAGIILTGDFNDTIDSLPYNTIAQTLSDTIKLTSSEDEVMSTYTDWGQIEDEQTPIDFIFTNKDATDYVVLDDISNGYVSDHYGILSTITL
ncbi:MAG: endonuclease/exonuclease/phosphatase family protein [Clostridiales bacterium]|nr:endonuclease/exonuclease/phosphatase family protein [Clostridiales bacterium]